MADVFFWRGETTTLDATHDFSAGDTTATANGAVSISSSSPIFGAANVVVGGAGQHYRFTNPGLDRLTGCISFSFMVSTWGANATLFACFGADANNIVQVEMAGTDEIRLRISTATGPGTASLLTNGADLVVDTLYHGVFRYAHGSNDRRIEIYNGDGSLRYAIEDLTTSWTAPTELGGTDRLRPGEATGNAGAFRYRNVRLGTAYDEPYEDDLLIESYTEAGGGGGITGDMAATENTVDTAAASARVQVHAALAGTDGADTGAVAARVQVHAALAGSDGADVAAVAARVQVHSALEAMDGADSAAIAAMVEVHASMAATDPPDVAAIDASDSREVSMAAVDGPDSAAFAVRVEVTGNMASSDGADLASMAARIHIHASMAATDPPDVFHAEELGPCIVVDLDPRDPDLTDVLGVAFLDRFGRFAKQAEDVAVVRFFYDDEVFCDPSADLTAAQYRALSSSKRTEIQNAPSGAGFVDTSGKSNA